MKKNSKKKGFTLIELIVVIAILGVLALVAVPKFAGMQNASKVKADAATAKQIVNAARVQMADENLDTWTDSTMPATKYVPASTPVSGGTFDVTYDEATDKFIITWTATVNGYAAEQTYTEGAAFTPVEG